MSKTRVALLGAGYIADWHLNALRRVPNVDVTAVCDVSQSAAEALAARTSGAAIFTSVDALVDAGFADAVHILTPPQHHFALADTLMDAGLAVFAEKPLALSAGDCRALGAKSATKKIPFGVNHNFLMLPSYDRLQKDIERRALGPISSVDVTWQFPLPPLRSGPYGLWMLREPGNLLFEIGSHLFGFVAHLLGDMEISSVDLRHPIVIPGGVTHYQSWTVNGVAGGAAVTINMSLIEGYDDRSITVRGLGGLAHYNYAHDTYRFTRAPMQDIVAAPFAAQMSVAGQAIRSGVVNAARQIRSANMLAPYGLSMTRAISSFYQAVQSGGGVDERLSVDVAERATRGIEAAIAKARPEDHAVPVKQPDAGAIYEPLGKTVLVIGGSGFIGRALTTKLADDGYNVRVFSRGSGAGLERADGRVSVATGSLKSREDLLNAMEGVDGVFHLARADEKTWSGYLENDVGVTKLIGACCLEAGVRRLVYTGTIDSYDASQPDRAITEETPFDENLEERNLYARSKAACEAALLAMREESGLPLVIVRPGIVIGPGGPLQHWGIAMWRGASACKLWGDGKNIMPFVLNEDVADGLVRAITTPDIDGRSFNLIGDPMLSARDYFEAAGEANNIAMRTKSTPIWTYFAVDVVKYWLKRLLLKRTDISRPSYRDWKSRAQLSPFRNDSAKSDLGWCPEGDRGRFIERGIAAANLFGILRSSR